MALLVCEKCGTKYAVGAAQCPHCGSRNHHEDGEKATPKPKPKDK